MNGYLDEIRAQICAVTDIPFDRLWCDDAHKERTPEDDHAHALRADLEIPTARRAPIESANPPANK